MLTPLALVASAVLVIFGRAYASASGALAPVPISPVNSGQLGDKCDVQNEPCSPNFSECTSENICKCKVGYIQKPKINDTCLEYVKSLGGDCVVSEQCQNLGPTALCRNYQCVCGNGAQPDKEMLKCVEGQNKTLIGRSCSNGEECVGFNPFSPKDSLSECTPSGVCSCREGFITTLRLDDCLPIVDKIGDRCWEEQQCELGSLGRLGTCQESNKHGFNVCRCVSSAISKSGENKCVPKTTKLHEDCQFQDQCTASDLGHSYCFQGKCQCLPGAGIDYEDMSKWNECIIKI